MKRASFFCFLAVLTACVLLFSGCVVIKVPVGTPESTTHQSEQPSDSVPPIQTQNPSQMPSSQPVLPDADVKAEFILDLDGDSVNETVTVGLGSEGEMGNEIIIFVSDAEGFNQALIESAYFESAYLAATPGGAPCVLVSCSYEDDNSSTYVCSFSGIIPVVHESVGGHVSGILGSEVTVNNFVDALGTWACSITYTITDDFEFYPVTDMQIDMSWSDPLVTTIELPVEMGGGGAYTPATLKPGTAVYPVSTDGLTYMNFRLKDFSEGRIWFTISDYQFFINGVSDYDCFEIVPYAG